MLFRSADKLRNWTNPVDGNEIMDHFKIPPGRKIAVLKDAVKEAIMEGKIAYDHDAAWQYLLEVAPGLLEE